MKKSDLKDLSFFREKDGAPDMFSLQLNCFETSVYNILLNQFKLDKKLIAALFIRDVNPTFWHNRTTGTFRMYNLSRNLVPLWTKYVKINTYVKEEDGEAVRFIESLLDQGHMVIFDTVFEMLGFYRKYDPYFDLKNFHPGVDDHNNIILYHDTDNFYYAEKLPYMVTMENYVPYEFNNQIGVISKHEIEKACCHYIKCCTVEVDAGSLRGTAFKEEVAGLFHSISDNFSAPEAQDGLYTRYYGKQAMEKFAELCDEGCSLDNYYKSEGWPMLDRICFDIWMIHGARTILMEYINIMNGDMGYSGDPQLLKNKIIETKEQWELSETIFNKMIRTEKPLDTNMGNRIRQQLISETGLIELLKKF